MYNSALKTTIIVCFDALLNISNRPEKGVHNIHITELCQHISINSVSSGRFILQLIFSGTHPHEKYDHENIE